MNNLLKTSLSIFILSAASAPAFATITFSMPVIQVLPGQTGVSVMATITNNDADTAFYNGDDLNLTGPFVLNDEFFTNVPISLAAGDNSGLIELFTFDVDPAATPASYIGTYDLFGGIGAANSGNFDLIDSQTFQVDVVPEPSTSLLLGGALIALLALRRFARM